MPLFTMLGVKGTAILALLLALGGWAGYKTYQVYDAQNDAKEARADRDAAFVARDKALQVNLVNQETIALLQQEKADIQRALTDLDADRKKNQQIIGALSTTIKAMASDPANRVQLSPVLQTTISEIQKQRVAREALP